MSTLLQLGYKSQYDSDAAASRNDCGPACLAMVLNGLGLAVTTDAVFQRTGAAADKFISIAQLLRVAESYNAPLEFRRDLILGELRGYLDRGQPLITLVQYAAFAEHQPGVSTQSAFKGPHFVTVVGYDTESVSVHDPLWTGDPRAEGAFKKWPNAVWQSAWGRCHEYRDAQGNGNPDFAALISVRPVSAEAKTQVSAEMTRRLRAKAAYAGAPQPDLSRPDSLRAAVEALGQWGRRVAARKVLPTDTLWRIAKAYYGDGNKLAVIRYFNGPAEADVIHDGQVLLIPEPVLNGDIPPEKMPTGSTPAWNVMHHQ